MNFEIIKTVHPKKGFNLWVVQLTTRVPKPRFMELYQKARELRGWYTSYNRDGYIPGFQFKNETAVQEFTGTPVKTTDETSGDNCPPAKGDEERQRRRGSGVGGGKITTTTKPATKKKTTNPPLAAKWQTLADSYLNEAEKKYNELENAATNTPKRMRQYNSKRVDADILSDMATLAKGIAACCTTGTLPKELEVLRPVKNKGDLSRFLPGHESNGYYDAHRADKPNWIDRESYPNIPGIKSHKQALKIYNLLKDLDTTSPEQREQRERELKIKELEDQVRFANIPGFFPTPKDIIERMILKLGVKSKDETILEPSAGMGSIAEVIRENYPNNELGTFEINHTLSELIKAKGFYCVNDDFLKFPVKADRIIMNPPFENRQDISHVQHAYQCLNTGGRLVSIMSAGPFYGSMKRDEQFREWLDETGAEYQKLPDDAFKSAFRSTGVQTYLVTINK